MHEKDNHVRHHKGHCHILCGAGASAIFVPGKSFRQPCDADGQFHIGNFGCSVVPVSDRCIGVEEGFFKKRKCGSFLYAQFVDNLVDRGNLDCRLFLDKRTVFHQRAFPEPLHGA